MGTPKQPASVRLIMGILAQDAEQVTRVVPFLIERFGPLGHNLDPIPYTWTNYYQDELGSEPVRCILTFETLIPREEIVAIKLWTNKLELQLSREGLRIVNLDPGYMTLGQFFLATTKDQRQRVYVSDGIFVEPTLYFQDGGWHAFPWTYRDWQSPLYLEYLGKVREQLAYQLTTGISWSQRKHRKELLQSKKPTL